MLRYTEDDNQVLDMLARVVGTPDTYVLLQQIRHYNTLEHMSRCSILVVIASPGHARARRRYVWTYQ